MTAPLPEIRQRPSPAARSAGMTAYWRWRDAHDSSPSNLVHAIQDAAYAVDQALLLARVETWQAKLRDALDKCGFDGEAQDHDGTMRRWCHSCGWHDTELDHDDSCPVSIATAAPQPETKQ